MFSKINLFFIVVGLVGILVMGCTSGDGGLINNLGELGDKVATVNGVDIGIEVFQDSVERMLLNYEQQGFDLEEEGEAFLEQIQQQAINSLVQEEVLLQSAGQKGYEAPEEMVEEEFAQVKGQFQTEEEFQAALEASGFTENEFKTALANDIKITQFIDGEIEEVLVEEDEVKEMYEQYKESLETQLEETEEAQEIPTFEEVKNQLEAEIKQGKEQEQVGQIVERLMENSEIEIFI
ncbi:SurA N-terminal domain-containing protein [Anaerovirgula multivorans]|uniref:SurA N-terminal domain-containing protein n=1 Tax=Anaerovirgula multivorans TaxID=312168 RepID=A0A239E8H9_9FIRM|nr:SurA N-terminal domain-containing protein [Anaerovirgula multivorans]SNS41015.1 SurA N-terminal domain-containing protein [Anaerovirgula multivorans]